MNIVQYPNEVLSTKCLVTSTSGANDALIKLDQELWDEETGSYLGAGLAANQIGLTERVAIVRINDVNLNLINPVITRWSDERMGSTEGCFSLGGKEFTVMRYTNIVVETDNYSDPLIINDFDVSRTVQHEIDHLDGKLVSDYAKVGRNEPCTCGSGKKYKKCCGVKR